MLDFATILSLVFGWQNLLAIFSGVVFGVLIGAIPGLGPVVGLSLILPLTFKLGPVVAISMLVGAFCGAIYGGSISATLIRTPGTPASIVTTFDAFAMAQKGKAGKALGYCLLASGVGGIFSALVMSLVSPLIADWASKFSWPEMCVLCMLGLSLVSAVSGDNMLKGLIAAVVGLLFATVGMDELADVQRFTFGNFNLAMGIGIISILVATAVITVMCTILGI